MELKNLVVVKMSGVCGLVIIGSFMRSMIMVGLFGFLE